LELFFGEEARGRSPSLPHRNCRAHELRPFYYLRLTVDKGFPCEKEMRVKLTFTRFKNRVADQFRMAIKIVQRGNRIIVIETFFAIPFSDLFQFRSRSNFLAIDWSTNLTFRECKQLKHERIHDRITQNCKSVFMSLLSQTRSWDRRNP